jgi:hypothetical protein
MDEPAKQLVRRDQRGICVVGHALELELALASCIALHWRDRDQRNGDTLTQRNSGIDRGRSNTRSTGNSSVAYHTTYHGASIHPVGFACIGWLEIQ